MICVIIYIGEVYLPAIFGKEKKIMKRALSILLLTCMLLSAFSLTVFAEGNATDTVITDIDMIDGTDAETVESAEKTESEEEIVDIAAFSCVYDAEVKRVKLSGTLKSDVFADHSDCTLAVYAIPFGMSEHEVIANKKSRCLAEAPVSIKFEFSFRASNILDRYQRYAVFLRSPSGEYTLTTEAQYPEVASTFEPTNNKKYYKGLMADYSSEHNNIVPGSAIIPIYWDSLFSDSSSSSLFMGADGEQFFFNKATIDQLDIAVRSMSLSDTRIYIRLLKTSDNTAGAFGADYVMPDVYDSEVVTKIHAAITFLTERYAGENRGISGYIIGKGWDDPEKYNYSTAKTIEEYIDRCTVYTVIVANAARTIDPKIEIAIPLTGEGFCENAEDGEKNRFMTIVESLLDYFDSRINGGINCSFLMDTSETPLGITNGSLSEGIDVSYSNDDGLFYAGAQKGFSEYLSDLDEEFRSCPKKYIFVWTPHANLRGNALAAAYVYSYYTLLSDSTVSLFALDLTGENGADMLKDVAYLMKYMDTSESLEVTRNLASFFGRDSWSEIVSASVIAAYGVRRIYDVPSEINPEKIYKGEFAYFDFSTSNLTERWYAGLGCKSLKIDYKAEGEKSLRADLSLNGTDNYSDLLYIYAYPENMIYTPYMRMRFHISDTSEDSLYEVKLSFGYSSGRAEASFVVAGNEATDVTMDLSEYVSSHMTESVRISVRSLDGATTECSLWVYGIYGCSDDYTSEQLEGLIKLERDNIRTVADEEESRELFGSVAIAIAIVVVTGAIGFGLFASFKREDKGASSDSDDRA